MVATVDEYIEKKFTCFILSMVGKGVKWGWWRCTWMIFTLVLV